MIFYLIFYFLYNIIETPSKEGERCFTPPSMFVCDEGLKCEAAIEKPSAPGICVKAEGKT